MIRMTDMIRNRRAPARTRNEGNAPAAKPRGIRRVNTARIWL